MLFIVDGHMEKLIVQRLSPGTAVWRLNLNGECKLEAMASRLVALIRRTNNRYHPIIIITDREKRDISSADMEKELLDHIQSAGVPVDQIAISVCDRTIENWILADRDLLKTSLNKDLNNPSDGLHGKSVIKNFVGRGQSYHETTDGVDLFCQISVQRAVTNSPSLRRFVERNVCNCHWLLS